MGSSPILTLITLILIVAAASATPVQGIEKRHEPLTSPHYTYLDPGEVENLIEELLSKPGLSDDYRQALQVLEDSLRRWDASGYSEAARTLESLLLSSTKGLSGEDAEALALLASSSLSDSQRLVRINLDVYSGILSGLAEQGLVSEDPARLADTQYLEDDIIRSKLGLHPGFQPGPSPVSEESLESVIKGLLEEKDLGETGLDEILEEMDQALRQGNYSGYDKLAERLGGMLSEGSVNASGLDEETLKELSYIASTRSSGGTLVFDPEKYVKLIDALSRSGLLDLLVPRDSSGKPIIDEELLRRILPRSISEAEEIGLGDILGEGGEGSMDVLDQFNTNGSLPNIRVPRIGGGVSKPGVIKPPHPAPRILAVFAGIPLLLAVAATLAVRERRLLLRVFKAARWSVESRLLSRRIEGSPRERVIKCFELLVALLSRRGYTRESWETHREYASKIRATPFEEPVRMAAGLYELAKYSIRPVEEEDASLCLRCLERVEKS